MSDFSLKILIVEDDLSFALELQMLLEELNYSVLAQVDNSDEALKVIYENHPDLILMDIGIKGDLSGIEVGHQIKDLQIPILYITSFNDQQYYEKAKSLSNMIGYMVKPIAKISLKSAIELSISKAYTLKNQNANTPSRKSNIVHKNYFFFKQKDTIQKVDIKKIAFVKSNDNYCECYLLSEKAFTVRIGISELEKMLPSKLFIRIHRQFIVQVACIDAVDFASNLLKIKSHTIPISRTKRKPLAALLESLR
ncbi:MAG: response regulator transcription factor [Chitinophagales bacterium]